MSGFYNPSTPDTLGLEWLIAEDPATVVLDSAAKSYGLYLPGEAGHLSEELAVYAAAVSGEGRFGCHLLSAPYVEAIPQAYETRYAGTDTGADFTSPTNGNAAWLDASSGAASYADVSPGVAGTTYLRNVNQYENPASPARMMMRGAGATQWTGRRILDVTLRVEIESTIATPTVIGCLNLAGVDYKGEAKAAPLGRGAVDMALATWSLNPATGNPWTLPELNNVITAGATDEAGILVSWDMRQTTNYADTIRVSKVYLRIRWQPEDRCGYAIGDVSVAGWQPWDAKSVPNLLTDQDANLDTATGNTGSWGALANTVLTNDADDPGSPWTRSMKITSSASGACGAQSGYYPAIAGKTYAFRGKGKWTSGRPLVLSIEFYDQNGNLLQTASGASDNGSGSYKSTGMTAPAAAPLGATQMRLRAVMTATAGAQTCFLTGMVVGLAEAAITYVQDDYPGALTPLRVSGGAEMTSIAHPTDELRIFRRVAGNGVMSLRTFGPGTLPIGMPLGMYSYRPVLQDAAGALLDLPTPFADVTAVLTTALHDYAAADGPIAEYSQPYAERVARVIDSTRNGRQELTLPAETYLVIRFLVAGQVAEPDGEVTLRLRRTSDDVQVGGDVIFDASDLQAIIPPGGATASKTTPQVLVLPIPSPAANSAAQHYVEITADSTVGSGFVFYVFDTMGVSGDSIAADTITFAGGVDGWTDTETGELLRRTAMLVLQTQPAPPTGVAAALAGTHVVVQWDPTSVGADHDATELWRNWGNGWEQIADLRDEAETSYSDFESPRGVPTIYRVRTRRLDGSVSDFSAETGAVATPGAETCGQPTWRFVSNEIDASFHFAAQNLEDADEWRRAANDDEPVVLEFDGRDGAVAFRSIEDPLDEADLVATMWWHENLVQDSPLQAPPAPGRAAFDALVALSRASISYVCILDDEGRRWFAAITVRVMRREREGSSRPGEYAAEIHYRELTRTPSTPIANT